MTLVVLEGRQAGRQAEALREQAEEAGAGDLVLQSSPPGARAFLRSSSTEVDLGTTPLLLRRDQPVGDRTLHDLVKGGTPPRLALTRPGYEASLDLPARWSDLDLALRSSVLLYPTLPLVSQALAWPLGAAALLAALAAGTTHLRRTAPPPLPEPGDYVGAGGRIGGYALGEEVGRGAMAEVFRGHPLPPARGATLAIKILHAEVAENQEFRQRFDREAEICRTLDHPGILRVHEVGEDRGRLFLAMDFIPGPSLREVLPREGMDPGDARALAVALAEALAHAHGRGIVHRDLKPENVLMAEDGRPLLADFGLARGERYETITATDTTLGTPAYMPPEQVTGHRSDPRADLYSLGCILYELLAGAPPFQGDAMAVIIQHMSEEPEPPSRRRPDVPKDLEAVVMRLLQKDPADRYPDAEALLRDLRA